MEVKFYYQRGLRMKPHPLAAQTGQDPDPTETHTSPVPGGVPLPPLWLTVVQATDLNESPSEISCSFSIELSQTVSWMQMFPLMLKFLFLVAFLQDCSFSALQAWHCPWHDVNEAVLGTCCAT
jgi:hypothetical protein